MICHLGWEAARSDLQRSISPNPLLFRRSSSSSRPFIITPTALLLLLLLSLLIILGVFLPWAGNGMPDFLFSSHSNASSLAHSKWRDYTLAQAASFVAKNGTVIVCARWPGHAVLVPPAPDSQTAHKFGSKGFFNFTSRRPRHLLHIVELGYNVMYNDVDMVWLADPFPYLQGSHDVYFTDDMAALHDFPSPY
ncbi:hypothetical protein CMV_021031 [Castanea mollissima]|uniref:Nucleotide-diphospho-sugar transferase domain-containing protein n=1 Tax=Castanea mollissima TaxID=60419 RepID=A0A8J4QZT3_9ROSI|nr:hypothetical protein CMV_021031 [Castanea mollissima]